VSEVTKKSALARKREAQEARRRRKSRLKAAGIGAVVFVVVAALVGTILYFTVFKESPPKSLVIKDLVVGTGVEAQSGDNVTVDYTGWLYHGKKFDSSVDRGEPFQFTLGAGRVIQGWDQGVAGMKVGGTRRLIIPPDLAYGASGQGDIPPNATLTFEVQLLAVE
jgi:FKBP-type peptidyl-prolyl cis-trans isomerase FkpA